MGDLIRLKIMLAAAVCLFLTISGHASPGDVDYLTTDVAATVGGTLVYGTTVQPDGRIILSGAFGTVQGQPRNNIARLNPDGTLDDTFDPKANDRVYSVIVQADGKILIGGRFTSLQPNGAPTSTARSYLARLNPDGSLDTGYSPRTNGPVYAAVPQPDGRVLLGGWFTQVAGQGSSTWVGRGYCARLHANGTLDTSFNPGADNYVYSIALQPDGKVLLGGDFGNLSPNYGAAVSRHYVARMNASGTLDTTFDPSPNGWVYAMALQPDGKVLLSGAFTTLQPNGQTTASRTSSHVRLVPDGRLDLSYSSLAGSDLSECIVLQANGSALTANDVAVRRLNTEGREDFGFYSRTEGTFYSLALQADGRVLAAGSFSTLQQRAAPSLVTRLRFARLFNDPASQTLAAPDATRILWSRSGSAPELMEVTFEISTDGGANWLPLGTGSRLGTSADWELTGLTLPGKALIRARGRTIGGRYNGCFGLIEQILAIGPDPVAEIGVSGNNLNIASGDTSPIPADFTDFLRVSPAGGTAGRLFTISNEGGADLTIGSISITGANAVDFSVTVPPAGSVAAGASTAFEITFHPSDAGLRTAAVAFATSDPDESEFHFEIQGTGVPAEIEVTGNTSVIVSGDSSPSPSDYTDLGTTSTRGGTITRSFIIRNRGGTGLLLGTPRITGAQAADFSITTPPLLSLVEEGTTPIGVTFAPSIPGTSRAVLSFTTSDSDENPFTFALSGVAMAAVPGYPAPASGEMFVSGGRVYAVAPQPDGKIVIGGNFQTVYGVPRRNAARLLADGSLDAGFDPGPDATVNCIAVQDDGKVLLGGTFKALQPNGSPSSVARRGLARVRPDGSVDEAFDCGIDVDSGTYVNVSCIVLQPDGKILIGGSFLSVRPAGTAVSVARTCIARIDATGGLDTGFDPAPNSSIRCMALQPDGKILLGGYFTTFRPNGAASPVSQSSIARLDPDGQLDAAFNPECSSISSVAVQADGRILVAGGFSTFRPAGATVSVARSGLARLFPDGTLDTVFNPGPGGVVDALAIQADGRILLGGSFPAVSPFPGYDLARTSADGTPEAAFAPRPDSSVNGLTLLADGSLLTSGTFTGFLPPGLSTRIQRRLLARLYNGPALQTLSVTSTGTVRWIRSGAAPELVSASFDFSTDNGHSWTPLGNATRSGTTANWELNTSSLPPAGQLRGRGRTTGGYRGGSSGIIEQVAVFPTLSPYQNWKLDRLGDAQAPDFDDPDGDGMVNFLEYALNGDPDTVASADPATPRTVPGSDGKLKYLFSRRAESTDLTLTVQAADSPAGPWADLTRSAAGGPFTVVTPGAGVTETGTGNVVDVTITDVFARNQPGHSRRFLRLKAERDAGF